MNPDASNALVNERQRFIRKQATGRAYMRQKAAKEALYAEQKAAREPFPRSSKNPKPWNDEKCELKLFLCDSVRAQLPVWSR